MRKVLVTILLLSVVFLTGCAKNKVRLSIMQSDDLTELRFNTFAEYSVYKDLIASDYHSNFFGQNFLFIYVHDIADESPLFEIIETNYENGEYHISVLINASEPGPLTSYALIFEIPKYPYVESVTITFE